VRGKMFPLVNRSAHAKRARSQGPGDSKKSLGKGAGSHKAVGKERLKSEHSITKVVTNSGAGAPQDLGKKKRGHSGSAARTRDRRTLKKRS